MKPEGWVIDLGRMPYKEAWDLQKQVHTLRVQDQIPDTLLLVEHPPVITRGRTPGALHVRVPFPLLKARGIEFYEVERGGDVTFHGPGQLVGYPIFRISNHLAGIRPFVRTIESALIEALRQFGIQAHRDPEYTGVFVGLNKIVAIGIAVKKWVAFHGFALNVHTDLRYFDLIVPCGIVDRGVTSMEKELQRSVPLDEVKPVVVNAFEKVFGQSLKPRSLQDLILKLQRSQIETPILANRSGGV